MKYELHGMRNTGTYKTWSEMRQRCSNKNKDNYKYYGGKGVKVCKEWDASFNAFYRDMGERPENHSIDRIDSSGDYTKENCRWSVRKEQARNKNNNRIIEYDGRALCLAEWAEIYDLRNATIWRRLSKGMTPPECFLPVGKIPRGSESHKTIQISKSKANTSGITGVHWKKASKKWQASIMVNGKAIHLGSFTDKSEAICARKSAEASNRRGHI